MRSRNGLDANVPVTVDRHLGHGEWSVMVNGERRMTQKEGKIAGRVYLLDLLWCEPASQSPYVGRGSSRFVHGHGHATGIPHLGR